MHASFPRRTAAVLGALALLTLPACTRSAPPGPTTPASRGAGAVVGDWDGAGRFADAVMARDLERARRFVAPGSPAERYLQFQADFAAADAGGGTPSPGAWRVHVDKHLGRVEIAGPGLPPSVWTDWRFAADGRILQWSTPESGALEERLWTAGSEATTAAGSVRVRSALANDDWLTIVLEIGATGGVLTPGCAATYTDAAPPWQPTPGAASPAPPAPVVPGTCFGADRIAAGEQGLRVLQFPAAGLGGTLHYRLRTAAGGDEDVALIVR